MATDAVALQGFVQGLNAAIDGNKRHPKRPSTRRIRPPLKNEEKQLPSASPQIKQQQPPAAPVQNQTRLDASSSLDKFLEQIHVTLPRTPADVALDSVLQRAAALCGEPATS